MTFVFSLCLYIVGFLFISFGSRSYPSNASLAHPGPLLLNNYNFIVQTSDSFYYQQRRIWVAWIHVCCSPSYSCSTAITSAASVFSQLPCSWHAPPFSNHLCCISKGGYFLSFSIWFWNILASSCSLDLYSSLYFSH